MRDVGGLVVATVALAVLGATAAPATAGASDEWQCDAGALREIVAAREDLTRALADLRRWRVTVLPLHEGATAEQLRGRLDRMAVAVHRLETHVGAFVSPPGLRRALDADVAAWTDRVGAVRGPAAAVDRDGAVRGPAAAVGRDGAVHGRDAAAHRIDFGHARRLLADPAFETLTARVHLVAAADRTARATTQAIEALTEGCPDQPRAAEVDAVLDRLGPAGGVAATTATAVALGGRRARQGPAADGADLAARHRELHGAMARARSALVDVAS